MQTDSAGTKIIVDMKDEASKIRPFKVALIEATEPASNVPRWVPEALTAQELEFSVRACRSRSDPSAYASEAHLIWAWGSSLLRTARWDLLSRCNAIIRSDSSTDKVPIDEATHRRIFVTASTCAHCRGSIRSCHSITNVDCASNLYRGSAHPLGAV